jgi:hypothetical protein
MSPNNNEDQTDQDVIDAATEALARKWERDTGTGREVFWSKLSDSERIEVEESQQRFADRQRSRGKAGW